MLRLVAISTSRPVSLRCTIISRCTIAYIQAFKFKVCKPRIEVRCASQSHIYTYTKLVDAFVPFRAATCALYYIICCDLSQFTASARYIHFWMWASAGTRPMLHVSAGRQSHTYMRTLLISNAFDLTQQQHNDFIYQCGFASMSVHATDLWFSRFAIQIVKPTFPCCFLDVVMIKFCVYT